MTVDRPPRRSYPLAERARRQLGREIWNIGVVDQSAADIARRGIVSPPRWLPPLPPDHMLADPAYRLLPDGGVRLYAEHLHFGRNVGELWCADLSPGADLAVAEFRPLLAPAHHVSYPFPLHDGSGRMLLTAESWQAGAVLLWEETRGTLRPLGTLLPGWQAVDPTLWQQDGRWWLFCTLQDRHPDVDLHLFHAPELAGPWTPHCANPVKRSLVGARPAGPLFNADGATMRPGQDSSRTYGGAVVLHEITRLDPGGFEERVIRRLEPAPGPYPRGLHTLCPAGDRTLVDGKRWRFDLAHAARTLRRKVGRAE
ncbi:MAG: hypothetical protein RQ966_04630 [Acetobacteraceae bacterium]|nr:hypothetical protein [Acetobacteraceae bacterium]